MILWTIQEEAVYHIIMEKGVYRCAPERIFIPECRYQYDWLVRQMEERIGPSPEGVEYPAWAWYSWEGERKKPDLRKERWGNGWKGERFVCMEIDIPENQVVLSDFDAWHFPLNNRLISYSDEEDDRLMAMYRTASAKDQKRMRESNWTRIFDIAHVNNDWITIGESIQATFWELRKEQVRKYGSLLRRNRSRDRDMWK